MHEAWKIFKFKLRLSAGGLQSGTARRTIKLVGQNYRRDEEIKAADRINCVYTRNDKSVEMCNIVLDIRLECGVHFQVSR